VLALATVAAVPPAGAQRADVPADTIYQLSRPSGWRAVGRITEERGDSISFETLAGARLELDRRQVRIRPARGRIIDGELWEDDRNVSRLFFAPTARTLRADEGYFGLFFILPFVGYGFSEDFTLAGGIPFPAGTLASTPFWVAPKVRVHNSGTTQVAAGLLVAHIPDWDWSDDLSYDPITGYPLDEPRTDSWLSIGYGVATFGTDDRAWHVGAGVAHTSDEGAVRVPLMVGGEYRFSRKYKWVTENWLIPGRGGIVTGGVRIIGERWSTDLGLMFLPGEPEVPYFPVASFSYAFGAGR
jgi:hypothetical protein